MRFSASDIRLLAIGAAVMALLSLLVIARDSFSVPAESNKPVLSPPGRKVSKELSNRPADVVLAHEIDRTIDESELTQARWGVFVMSLNDGRIVYSRNGDKLFTPASNMKIYTTA